jgi:hypothetical protein
MLTILNHFSTASGNHVIESSGAGFGISPVSSRSGRNRPAGDDLTLDDPTGENTHCSARAMAKVAGIGAVRVRRIWKAHGLTPHQIKTFEISNNTKFADSLSDVVCFYVNLPAHGVVLSINGKSQIQVFDCTQRGLSVKKGWAGTITHDYVPHGTVIGRNMQRHRHQEFTRFLNQVEATVPACKAIHAIVDNYATYPPSPNHAPGPTTSIASSSPSRGGNEY